MPQVLNELAPGLPELMGGSADLTPSNLTNLKCSGDYQVRRPCAFLRSSSHSPCAKCMDCVVESGSNHLGLWPQAAGSPLGSPAGRYIRFGVREHAMAAICNGMAAHGGLVTKD